VLNQAGFHGVAVDVSQAGKGMVVVLNDCGPETVAPECATDLVPLVVSLGERGFKFTQNLGKIGFVVDSDEQMEVIVHSGKGVDNSLIFCGDLLEDFA
jgi:hypothetical protein